MNKMARRLASGFSTFLLLCAVINLAGGHIGAAVCGVGAGVFYWALSSADDEKTKKETDHT